MPPIFAVACSCSLINASSPTFTLIVAWVSLTNVVLFTASLPALSNTLTLAVMSPSANSLIFAAVTDQLPSLSKTMFLIVSVLPF